MISIDQLGNKYDHFLRLVIAPLTLVELNFPAKELNFTGTVRGPIWSTSFLRSVKIEHKFDQTLSFECTISRNDSEVFLDLQLE